MRRFLMLLLVAAATLLQGCPTTGEPNMSGQPTLGGSPYPYNPRW